MRRPFVRLAALFAPLLPARYRREIVEDLLEECDASIRPQRGRFYAAAWLVSHLLRSAVSARLLGRDTRRAGEPPARVHARSADGLASDWHIALRSLTRAPVFTAVAIVTTAAAIGLSVAVFSLVSSVLLRPLPYPDADRLVRLAEFRTDRSPEIPPTGGLLAAVTVGEWIGRTETLDALVPVSVAGKTIALAGQSEHLAVASVGGRFFDVFRTEPDLGRLLNEADETGSAPEVAVISRRLRAEALSRSRDVLGRVLAIDGVPHTIVGVAPPGMPVPAPDVDVWVPGRWTWPDPGARSMFSVSLDVVGRMREGARLEDVLAEGERILRSIAMADPRYVEGDTAIPRLRAVPLLEDLVAEFRPALRALFAGMALVLAAACVSLANLLVARNTARARDVAIRAALGASRARLLRPLLFEQLVVVGTGVALGGLLGWWLLRALPGIAPDRLPRLDGVVFDHLAFAAASLAILGTAMVAGLRPAWARQPGHTRDLTASGGGRTSSARPVEMFRGVLVASQVALALTLLAGASLIGRSLWELLQVRPGYKAEDVLTFQVRLPPEARRERGRLARFHEELISRIRAVPGVTAAGLSSTVPLLTGVAGMTGTFWIEGVPRPADPADAPRANTQIVSSDYLRAIGTRVLAGRGFDERDLAEAPRVALVDEVVARRYFGGDPIGRRIIAMGKEPWTIAGVVETVKLGPLSGTGEATIYLPTTQAPEGLAYNRIGGGIVVRTSADPASLIPVVRGIVRDLDAAAPVFNAVPLADRVSRTFDQPRFYAIALALFAALTLTTAVLGVYGVQAYTVEQRTLEFGVRRALGASETHIVALIMKRALLLGAAGIAFGLPLTIAGTGLMRTLLFGVAPLDPPTFLIVPLALLALVLAASIQPARRALRADPAAALRCE